MGTSFSQRIGRLHLQRYLLTGLLTLLPLWLTWVIFTFVLGLLAGLSAPWIQALAQPLANAFPTAFGWLGSKWVQNGIALVVTVVTIYVVGWATTRVIGQRLLEWLDHAVQRIPLVKTIYGGTKKLLEMMQTKPDGTQRVVLVDFPHRDMKAVGLVTRTLHDPVTGQEIAAVYVPTTPNPTSGYLELVPMDRLTPTDWSIDTAMSFIISGGAISPETISFSKPPTQPPAR